MFDFAWSEIVLIGVVALIAIGPKDLPVAMKAVTDMVKKARRMAAEFQTHVDDMMRDANLNEVRSQINQIRNFDIKGEIERAVDADGTIRQTFSANPLEPAAGAAGRQCGRHRGSRPRRRRRRTPPPSSRPSSPPRPSRRPPSSRRGSWRHVRTTTAARSPDRRSDPEALVRIPFLKKGPKEGSGRRSRPLNRSRTRSTTSRCRCSTT